MHLVEKQLPSEKELTQQIKEAERELLMLDKNDRVLAQLSLTIQLYYLNGGNDEGKQKALNIIDKFKNTYPLKSHFPFNASGFTEFTEKSYQSAFKNAKKLVKTVETIPLSSIVLETDCPYMAPEPHRGTRNDSRNIPYVIAKIAEIKGVSVEEVEQTTRENAFALFTKVPR
jgi:hypothetical protein